MRKVRACSRLSVSVEHIAQKKVRHVSACDMRAAAVVNGDLIYEAGTPDERLRPVRRRFLHREPETDSRYIHDAQTHGRHKGVGRVT